MRIGIINLFWFGLTPSSDTLGVGFYHSDEDDLRVRDLIRYADVEALALVEIVDVPRLERLLKKLPGTWRARDLGERAVTSADTSSTPDNVQRVVLAWNDDSVELTAWDRPIASGPRRPIVARLRHRSSGFEVTAVLVHPKSGNPLGWEALGPSERDHVAGVRRTQFFEQLASWLQTPAPPFSEPHLVLGDFNSVRSSRECRRLQGLPDWNWPEPTFLPPTAEPRTTLTDPAIIDHFVLSPGLNHSKYEVIAFDELDDFPDAQPTSPKVWKRTTDHRFVRITIEPT
jgi:hypothetical protein